MAVVTLARHAMATRFEMVLHGDNPVALRAAGEEALEEIERLESQLSLFRDSSEIAHLNAHASREAVRVSPRVFGLLERARLLQEESGGAFDITIAPLMRCWGFQGGTGRRPSEKEITEARARVGMHLVLLNRAEVSVRFLREGVMLDLGAIGKGYAIDQAVELLREAGVSSGLLHGGTSTIYALGHPPEAEAWQIAITNPEIGPNQLAHTRIPQESRSEVENSAALVPLKDEAMSVSAVWGKYFQEAGEVYGHIIDPRTGRPAAKAILAAVALGSATETDALSTALLTVGPEGHDAIARLRDGMRTLVIGTSEGQFCCRSNRIRPLGKLAPGVA